MALTWLSVIFYFLFLFLICYFLSLYIFNGLSET